MTLFFQNEALLPLMEDFYTITGIKIVLFDENFTELLCYPREKAFCNYLRENAAFDARCRACDKAACLACREQKGLHVYKCHAGLTEAVAPIEENGRIIGYMMFGPVCDEGDRETLPSRLRALATEYREGWECDKFIKRFKYRSGKQIRAAARILDMLSDYIRQKEMVRRHGQEAFDEIVAFIDAHPEGDLSVAALARAVHMGRTALYETVRRYTGEGVAALVLKMRMERARALLLGSEMKITEISEAVGFSDYNYFLRVFKRVHGISPKRMRAAEQE